MARFRHFSRKRVCMVVGTLACSAAMACGDGVSEESTEQARQKLHDGNDGNTFADGGTHPSALSISVTGFCGGVLVASNVIATAAHCVDDHQFGQNHSFPTVPPVAHQGAYQVAWPSLSAPPGLQFPSDAYNFPKSPFGELFVSQVLFNPAYPTTQSASDIALVVLSTKLDRRLIRPARVASAVPGATLADVFGMSGCGVGANFLRQTTTSPPTSGAYSFPGLSVDDPNVSHLCEGDSGSPIFAAGSTNAIADGTLFSLVSAGTPSGDLNGATYQRPTVGCS